MTISPTTVNLPVDRRISIESTASTLITEFSAQELSNSPSSNYTAAYLEASEHLERFILNRAALIDGISTPVIQTSTEETSNRGSSESDSSTIIDLGDAANDVDNLIDPFTDTQTSAADLAKIFGGSCAIFGTLSCAMIYASIAIANRKSNYSNVVPLIAAILLTTLTMITGYLTVTKHREDLVMRTPQEDVPPNDLEQTNADASNALPMQTLQVA